MLHSSRRHLLLSTLSLAALLSACQESVLSFPGKDAGGEDAGPGIVCGTGTTLCGNACVNLEKDPDHCGSCTRACATTEGCAANKCYPKTCTGTDCATNQLCDQEHCREVLCLGVACPAGQACFEGTCRTQSCGAITCTGNEVCIGTTCVDPSCTGITCPSGSSCRDGQCIANSTCVSGATCAPASNGCHVGSTTCDGGVLSCNDQNINAPNGIACGDGGVCSSGTCVSCTANKECAVANPCHVGKTSCSAGVESCVDSTVAQPNGTPCGTSQICLAGSCSSCAEDAACMPAANPCHKGAMRCSAAGGPTCSDMQVQQPVGTTCGTDSVCATDGGCVPCRAGVACALPGQPCRDGVISCASGEAVCVDQNAKPAGTTCDGGICNTTGVCAPCVNGSTCTPTDCTQGVISCGVGGATCGNVSNVAAGSACTGGVCVGSTCVPCVADASCTDNANPACRVGKVQCSASGRACVDDTAKANGTACTASGGSAGVCSAGSCVACVQGQACTTNPNACMTGKLDCSTGTPTCVNDTNKTAGTTCSGGVCSGAGVCNACVTGAACTTNANACTNGVVSCTTGVAVCTDGAARSAGTTCAGGVCNGSGTCNACVQSAVCTTNSNACMLGVTDCTSGAPICNNGSARPAGTTCSGGVCSGTGTCNACVTGQSCATNTNACANGVVSCTSGAAVCANGTNKAVGATCPGGVCNGSGVCSACTQGSSCATNSNPCTNGVTDCASGSAVCTNGTNKTAGSSCPGGVCNGAGTCNACVAGAACATNPNAACMNGTTVCTSGAAVCADGSAKAAGTACAGGVCSGSGTCNACSAGAACTGNPGGECVNGTVVCSSGSAVCTNSTNKAAGVTCAGGSGVCNGGGACGSYASCAALLAAMPGLASGVYPIDPDGAGGLGAFNVYCDMATSGGGWTVLPMNFGDASFWTFTMDKTNTGAQCTTITTAPASGLFEMTHSTQIANTQGYGFFRMHFNPPLAHSEVRLVGFKHSSATSANNMDFGRSNMGTPTSNTYGLVQIEAWYFPDTGTNTALKHVHPGPGTACVAPYVNALISSTYNVCRTSIASALQTFTSGPFALGKTVTNFEMLVGEHCGSSMTNGVGERFRIEHPADGPSGTWQTGIMVR